ncbi:MAG: type II toxin-antitoxin system VapB family antitoxin [Parvularculaceae bacterium]
MALFIRDDKVDALANELQAALKTATKKEAVRIALEHELERIAKAKPRRFDFSKAQAIAASIGRVDPDFDFKKFRDELWGDED